MAYPFYRVITTDAADQEYRRLSPEPRRYIKAAIRKLAYSTNDLDTKPLEGIPDTWRVRVNRLRIIFELEEAERIIRVTRIRPRKTAYEGIERPPRGGRPL